MQILGSAQESARFTTESELYGVLSGRLPALVAGDSTQRLVRCAIQQPVGAVIPDVVVAHTPKEFEEISRAPVTAFAASVVALLLKKGPLRLATMAEHLYANQRSVERPLMALLRQGVVGTSPGGAFRLVHAPFLRETRLLAVEAKLSRWREALTQAVRYREFASEAYVALPVGNAVVKTVVQDEARAAGVGLIAVASGDLQVLVRARHAFPRTPDFVWLAYRMLSRRTSARHVSVDAYDSHRFANSTARSQDS